MSCYHKRWQAHRLAMPCTSRGRRLLRPPSRTPRNCSLDELTTITNEKAALTTPRILGLGPQPSLIDVVRLAEAELEKTHGPSRRLVAVAPGIEVRAMRDGFSGPFQSFVIRLHLEGELLEAIQAIAAKAAGPCSVVEVDGLHEFRCDGTAAGGGNEPLALLCGLLRLPEVWHVHGEGYRQERLSVERLFREMAQRRASDVHLYPGVVPGLPRRRRHVVRQRAPSRFRRTDPGPAPRDRPGTRLGTVRQGESVQLQLPPARCGLFPRFGLCEGGRPAPDAPLSAGADPFVRGPAHSPVDHGTAGRLTPRPGAGGRHDGERQIDHGGFADRLDQRQQIAAHPHDRGPRRVRPRQQAVDRLAAERRHRRRHVPGWRARRRSATTPT